MSFFELLKLQLRSADPKWIAYVGRYNCPVASGEFSRVNILKRLNAQPDNASGRLIKGNSIEDCAI